MSGETASDKVKADAEGRFLARVRPAWLIAGSAAAVMVLIILLIAIFVDPAPPRSIRLATGAPGGAYAAGGEAIRDLMAEHGVTVELVETSGSVENLALLTSGEAGVDAALLQGGIGAGEGFRLLSLGALFFEPVFIFTRGDIEISDMRDLRGRQIAAGPDGSGTRAIADMLLAENGVVPPALLLSQESGAAAATALRDGLIDASIFVTALDRPYILDLISDPDITLLSLERGAAYERRHRYLSRVTLPEGVIDLAGNVPDENVTLLATAAGFVIRPDLHPALQELLLEAIFEEYATDNILADPGTFPNSEMTTFPLSEEAERYFVRGGPPFLQRYMPFWAANLVDRLWLLVIPLATLLYPLFKVAPPAYRWRIRRRIITWYRDLRELEMKGRAATSEAEQEEVEAELTRILHEVGDVEVPLSYNDDLFRLRSHIRFVRQILREEAGKSSVAEEAAATDDAM